MFRSGRALRVTDLFSATQTVFGFSKRHTAALLLGAALIATSHPNVAAAQHSGVSAQAPLIIKNDRGGRLRDRVKQISQLRKQSRPVQITGSICYSTCTMLLGLPGTCVSPATKFGFHGPSSYGNALDTKTFLRASEIIASYYPEPLERWYLKRGRFKLDSMYHVSGDQIIKMGVRAC